MKGRLGRYALGAWHGALALLRAFLADEVMRLSAALTYYTVLSLFPALFVVVSLLGLVGLSSETLTQLLTAVGEKTGSEWVVDLVSGVLSSILDSRSTEIFLGAGIVLSLWAASGYVNAFMWASDCIYRPPARRSYWRGMPLRLGIAVLLLVLFTAAIAAVTLLGPLGSRIADAAGLESSQLFTLTESASPILFVAALLMLVLLFKYAPSRRQPPFWRLLPGAFAALILWVVVSLGFSFYLTHFGSYNRVYGTLGAAVAFLVWAWIVNIATLVGVEINRAVERPAGTEIEEPEEQAPEGRTPERPAQDERTQDVQAREGEPRREDEPAGGGQQASSVRCAARPPRRL